MSNVKQFLDNICHAYFLGLGHAFPTICSFSSGHVIVECLFYAIGGDGELLSTLMLFHYFLGQF